LPFGAYGQHPSRAELLKHGRSGRKFSDGHINCLGSGKSDIGRVVVYDIGNVVNLTDLQGPVLVRKSNTPLKALVHCKRHVDADLYEAVMAQWLKFRSGAMNAPPIQFPLWNLMPGMT
jgi:hypothetical protein